MKLKYVYIISITILIALLCILIGHFKTESVYPERKKQHNIDTIESFKEKYPDVYAGEYVDDKGMLHINIVEGKDESIKNAFQSANVEIHYVNYSLAFLESLVSTLSKNMISLGIEQIELSEKNNKVYVYLKDFTKENIDLISKEINSQAVVFKKSEVIIVTQ